MYNLQLLLSIVLSCSLMICVLMSVEKSKSLMFSFSFAHGQSYLNITEDHYSALVIKRTSNSHRGHQTQGTPV